MAEDKPEDKQSHPEKKALENLEESLKKVPVDDSITKKEF
jgi:hypothetical protein